MHISRYAISRVDMALYFLRVKLCVASIRLCENIAIQISRFFYFNLFFSPPPRLYRRALLYLASTIPTRQYGSHREQTNRREGDRAGLTVDLGLSALRLLLVTGYFSRQLWRYVRGILATKNIQDYQRYCRRHSEARSSYGS